MKKREEARLIHDADSIASITGRRAFLKAGAAGAAGILFTFKLQDLLGKEGAAYDPKGHWWGFMVDLTKCIGCGACVRACKAENNVPDGYFRTWVERYTFLEGGDVKVDSPDGAFNGFSSDPPYDPNLIEKSFFVPKLCNHCAKAPCVQVCPVGASYISEDGVVLVDHKHCIGCGYCIQACPYGSRFLSPEGYADKCTLCYHRITKGLDTACVQACPVGARAFGNLDDPDSSIRKMLGKSRYGVLKADLGTEPKCYYIGLDQEVR
ncbi:MAG: 4Fe-4S dicluster domain-containing protein [Deltaproteobacteria bacterium]|nr:4Fe-4S dicluster domain-containing protein [Deltaproteobacteria bacterium]